MSAPSLPANETFDLACLVVRTLDHQQRYFKASGSGKQTLLAECRDLERRLRASAEEIVQRFLGHTPSMFAEEGGDREAAALLK